MPYMVTFTINIPQMLPYMAYMDPMGNVYSFSLPSKPVNALLYLDSRAKSSTAAGTKQSEHGQSHIRVI